MRITKRSLLGCALAFALGAVLPGVTTGTALAWEPQKPVEFVIMAGQGGGADKMARLMQVVIEKNGWSSKPLTPINKPGGSGAEALVHLQGKADSDPNHTIMVTLNSFYTTPMRQPKLEIDIATFTPIARMAERGRLLPPRPSHPRRRGPLRQRELHRRWHRRSDSPGQAVAGQRGEQGPVQGGHSRVGQQGDQR